ncbi:MAG: hypothetical protein ACRDO2_05375 [Nocardioidaceae bacterium]
MAHEAPGWQQPSRPDHTYDFTSNEPVVIDCDRCSVRGIGCGDCVVTVLLGGPPYGVALDDDERQALDVLADAGLVPPLRMVESVESRHVDPS